MCEGQEQCTVNITHAVAKFDICPKHNKYTMVNYTCTGAYVRELRISCLQSYINFINLFPFQKYKENTIKQSQ